MPGTVTSPAPVNGCGIGDDRTLRRSRSEYRGDGPACSRFRITGCGSRKTPLVPRSLGLEADDSVRLPAAHFGPYRAPGNPRSRTAAVPPGSRTPDVPIWALRLQAGTGIIERIFCSVPDRHEWGRERSLSSPGARRALRPRPHCTRWARILDAALHLTIKRAAPLLV